MHNSISWAIFTGLAALCLFQGKTGFSFAYSSLGNGTLCCKRLQAPWVGSAARFAGGSANVLTSMAGTSFSRPGSENIDLILAATRMGDCMCISKMCLCCSPLGPWLCSGSLASCTSFTLTQPGTHVRRGSAQMGRAAGLQMCCLCDWGEITGGNFKYWPVNLQSFPKQQSGWQRRMKNNRVPLGRCWPAVWLPRINPFAGA